MIKAITEGMDAINNVLEIKSIFLILFVYLFSVILENT